MKINTAKITSSLFIFLFSCIMLIPFIMMIVTSLKTMGEIQSGKFIFLPETLMFSNYIEAMRQGDWSTYFFNTFFVTSITVIISLIFNSTAGFSFARLKFRGRDLLFIFSLIGMMIPPQVTMIPVYIILKHIPFVGGNDLLGQGGTGWIDSYMGLIAPYVAGSFGVFLFRQFYLNFPSELDDAAKIDGLNRIQCFWRIYVPLSKSVFATLICLKATHSWNEYIWPLIITSSENMKTVQLALSLFRDEYNIQWNYLMAATTLIILPLLILFLLAQKYFVEGIATTGIKG